MRFAKAHYAFYGDYLGVRTARKHIGWYVRDLPGGEQFRRSMNRIEDCAQQLQAAQAKVQEETPVLTLINPPAAPLSPSSPKRGILIVAFIFLGVVFSASWILLGRGWVNELKEGPHDAE